MAKKKSLAVGSQVAFDRERAISWSSPLGFHVVSGRRKSKNTMSSKTMALSNDYKCAIERTQNSKYNIRVRAIFGSDLAGAERRKEKNGWTLPVYFLASTFNGAMKKLEESIQLLQKSEDRLRFWGVERSDDPNMAGDLLREFGLWVDRRKDFPRKIAEIRVTRERPVPASVLALTRRVLADSIGPERPLRALAGD